MKSLRILSILFGVTVMSPLLADDFDDHWEALKSGQVLFRMADESRDPKLINPSATDDLVVVSGQVSGRYVNDDDYGYLVEVKLSNGRIKKFYFRVGAVDGPLNYLFFRGWLPRVVKTSPLDRGIDPCYTNAPPYSLWYRQDRNGKLEKVETAACPGKEPFLTPEKKEELELLNKVRDLILTLGASEPFVEAGAVKKPTD